MRKFLRHLSPFAPDDSGAVSALFECGGLIVICDAGGCTGNVCGFDEPRWFTRRAAIFSAGLRDMDAILGRDKRLVEKLAEAAAALRPPFTAIVGTPVPAIIGTDFRALQRMAEKATGVPCLALPTTGTRHYDAGVAAAQLALARAFADAPRPVAPGLAGILGATPLDLSRCHARPEIAALQARGYTRILAYGLGSGLDAWREAPAAERNFVVSPAGLDAAEWLRERHGTPYEILPPSLPPALVGELQSLRARRVLAIHQAFAAEAVRAALPNAEVTCATWFRQPAATARPGDFTLTGEDDFAARVAAGGYDCIVGDRALRHALPEYGGAWLDHPHFAIAGHLEEPPA